MRASSIIGFAFVTLVSASVVLWLKSDRVVDQFARARHSSELYETQTYENITKSRLDERAYRGLKLQNHLKVLLISDPTTDISAASLAVTVGSINEPIPGLAHFLEHMLFMGSEKYPRENDFEKFINSHAGSTNAFTDVDITNFQFRVDSQSLAPTLDRFAQFFIAPLLAPSAIEREVMAVNSEHKMYISDDDMRLEQLEIAMSKPNHAYNHFFTGNVDTLYNELIAKNISIRNELLKFHSTWYSSNIMNLVVIGKENLDQLEKLVLSLFGKIDNKNVTAVTFSYENHPWGRQQVERKILVVPVADVRKIKLIFPTPSVDEQYKTAPAYYLANLIGHEGPRGLLSTLKKKDMCVTSSVSYESYSGIAFFTIEFDLTEEAVSHMDTAVDEIITLTFQFIRLVKEEGIEEWIFEENKKTNEIAFTYKDKESPLSYAVSMSAYMHRIPIEDIASFQYSTDTWEPSLIKQYLGFLTPNNMNIFIASKSFEEIADQAEHWYGTKYKVDAISNSSIKKWDTIEMSSELHLPLPNDFITKRFDLYPVRHAHNSKSPYVIRESSIYRMWFLQDDRFKLPKLGIRIEVLSPISSSSPNNRNMLELFVRLFNDVFDEAAYPAILAGLQWSIFSNDYGINIELFGFDEKLPDLLQMLVSNIVNFRVNENRFRILKELYIRDLKNFEAGDLYTYAGAHLNYLIRERQWTDKELLAATEGLQSDDLQKFALELFSRVYMQGLIHGNCDERTAMGIVDVVEKTFNGAVGVPPEKLSLLRQVEMKDGSNLRYEIFNRYHPQSCFYAYYQCNTESALNNTLMELFVQIIEEPCFNVLRTQEQLGYFVMCGARRMGGEQGLVVIIESDKHPLYVNSRVEAFLQSIQETLENMTDSEFRAHKTALSIKKLEKPKQLDELTDKYWSEIRNRLYNFDRQKKEVKQLKSIKKKDILAFYQKYISRLSSRRRKVAINVISKITKPVIPDNVTIKETKIESIDIFRKTAKFISSPVPYINILPLGTKR